MTHFVPNASTALEDAIRGAIRAANDVGRAVQMHFGGKVLEVPRGARFEEVLKAWTALEVP